MKGGATLPQGGGPEMSVWEMRGLQGQGTLLSFVVLLLAFLSKGKGGEKITPRLRDVEIFGILE